MICSKSYVREHEHEPDPDPNPRSPRPAHSPSAISEHILPADLRRGRGAATNVSGRFELQKREEFDDGWTREEAPEALATEVTWEKPKAIITRDNSPDIQFDRSINPYRGCEHGCFYCYARPTHAYMGLSARTRFRNPPVRQGAGRGASGTRAGGAQYRPAPVAFGANTDPYQPIERQYRITRSLIETLARARHRSPSSPNRTSFCEISTCWRRWRATIWSRSLSR